MPIDPSRFEQFFRRNSSGDWVYIGYGPDVHGRIVSSHDKEWLLWALVKLSYWKRWTVALFSAPLVWLLAAFLFAMTWYQESMPTRWLFRHRRELSWAALALLALFLVSTALLAAHPIAREFARMLSKKPKDEPVGIERFMQNVGAVNGPLVTTMLMGAFGALFVPGALRPDSWPYFVPFSALWLWMAWHAWAGAFWRPSPDDA